MASTSEIRIVMEGVTGRLGTNQHLIRSLLAIAKDGGVALADGSRLMPVPILLGRSRGKLAALASAHGGLTWSTDRAACLSDPKNAIYFDVSATGGRFDRASEAIRAGKHVYLEKPIASSFEQAMALAKAAEAARVKNGVVQDKLFLPGLLKLKKLKDAGFFGRVLSAKLDFGWWIFDGEMHPAQRSSWNYKKAEGGGLFLDMYPHWRYIVDKLIGEMRAVTAMSRTQAPVRRDEKGVPYDVDVEDHAVAIVELDNGAVVTITSSWATRVAQEDMLTIQIDGTDGSAVAGLHDCVIQPAVATPKPVWNVEDATIHAAGVRDAWHKMPENEPFVHSYRAGWERFLRHVAEDAPFPSPLIDGARGLQLVEACHTSQRERRWVDLPAIAI
ncbi:Gfo/Idh/MocA family protein [Acuticoccus kandeliae]|uniref:Gfo/Idh/MocA family protein n=1 Tax=Acuticoccus kandeliae TaxID=2073160 RepID=UPI000D3E5E9E|nr:Gfo/Idh/MocA family oxidoreductase [Acuticoccus kandeliae]